MNSPMNARIDATQDNAGRLIDVFVSHNMPGGTMTAENAPQILLQTRLKPPANAMIRPKFLMLISTNVFHAHQTVSPTLHKQLAFVLLAMFEIKLEIVFFPDLFVHLMKTISLLQTPVNANSDLLG